MLREKKIVIKKCGKCYYLKNRDGAKPYCILIQCLGKGDHRVEDFNSIKDNCPLEDNL